MQFLNFNVGFTDFNIFLVLFTLKGGFPLHFGTVYMKIKARISSLLCFVAMLISFFSLSVIFSQNTYAAGLSKLGYAAFTESHRQLDVFSYFGLDSFGYTVELPSNASLVSLEVDSSSSLTLKDDNGNYYPQSGGYFHSIPIDDSTTLYLTVKDIGTYTITFNREAPPSDDASISGAYYEFYAADGTRLTGKQFNGFSSSSSDYSFDMPEGSLYFTFQPSVSSGASVSYSAGGQSVQYSYIPVSANGVTVTVTAEAGNTKTYNINFNPVKKEEDKKEDISSSQQPESSSSSSSSYASSEASSELSSSESVLSSENSASSKQDPVLQPKHITNSLVSSFIIFGAALVAIIIVLVAVLKTGLHKKD